MRRLYRSLLLALAAFCFLFAMAVTILIFLVDPNNFKEEIGKKVYQTTGRTFRIGGDIRWTLFPWLGLEAHDVRLGNAPDFSQTYFAHVESLSFQLRLRSLLSGQLAIDTLRLAGLDLQLERFADGRTNWEMIEPTPENAMSSQENSAPFGLFFLVPVQNVTPSNLISMHISHLHVTDAQLHFVDQKNNTAYRVWNIQTDARGMQLQRPFELQSTFEWEGPFGHGPVELQSQVTLDINHAHYALNNLRLKTQIHTDDKKTHVTDLSIDADINGATQTITLSRCRGLLLGAPIDANFSLVDFTNPIITGQLTADEWAVGNLRLTKIKTALNTAEQRLTIAPINFEFYAGKFEGKATIDLAPNFPHLFNTTGTLSKVNIQGLFQDLTKSNSISGIAEMDFTLHGQWFEKATDLIQSMKGTLALQVKEGNIAGFDIGYWLSMAQAPITGSKPANFTSKTTFNRIEGHITLADSILRNTDMIMESALFTAKGHGTLQLQLPLLKSPLAYQWQANTPQSALPLAIRITGPLDHLSIRPDMDAYARALLKKSITHSLLRVPAAVPGINLIGLPLENEPLKAIDQ